MNRRRFMIGVGGIAALTTAGCTDDEPSGENDGSPSGEATLPPAVSQDGSIDWEQVEKDTKSSLMTESFVFESSWAVATNERFLNFNINREQKRLYFESKEGAARNSMFVTEAEAHQMRDGEYSTGDRHFEEMSEFLVTENTEDIVRRMEGYEYEVADKTENHVVLDITGGKGGLVQDMVDIEGTVTIDESGYFVGLESEGVTGNEGKDAWEEASITTGPESVSRPGWVEEHA